MAMSNTLALSSSKPNKAPAKIKCPVDEIGKNSVKPSTTPIKAALNNNMKSTNAPENLGGLSLLDLWRYINCEPQKMNTQCL